MHLIAGAFILCLFMACLFISVPSMARKPVATYSAIAILLLVIGWAILRSNNQANAVRTPTGQR